MDIRDPEALNAQLKLAQLKGKTVRHELLWSPERQRIPAHHTRSHHSPQQTPLMKRDAGAREGGQFLCGHKVTGNKADWVTVPGWSPENLTEIPHGSGNGVCTLCSGKPNRSGRALEENPEASVYLLALRPTLLGHDSLLLPLLQLVVSALLVLQQHSSVLQVPGEVVALPLQLVSRLLGPFIRSL